MFGVNHPNELSEDEISNKYTFSTKKVDQNDDDSNSIVIVGNS